MKRATGNWVDGDRFWDRSVEIAQMIEYLDEGANILLIAQRRMGKTSLMREVGRILGGKYRCLQVDLQKAQCAADAIVELSVATRPYASLWGKATAVFGQALDKVAVRLETMRMGDLTVTLRSGLNSENWQAKGDELFDALAQSEEPVVVFLDEVPILIDRLLRGSDRRVTPDGRRDADAFMSWIRSNAIRVQGKVRIVITGSIGLAPVLHEAGLNATLNTFTPLNLGPWTEKDALGCLAELAKEYGLNFEAGSAQQLVERLGCCVPHYVQMFFDKAYQACRLRETRQISLALVEEVYETSMLGIRGHAELSHMEERLMWLGPEIYPLALEILTQAAVTGRLTPEAARGISSTYTFDTRTNLDALRYVLEVLEHDGYLRRDKADNYKFESNLLRDWWKVRFGQMFCPFEDRRAR